MPVKHDADKQATTAVSVMLHQNTACRNDERFFKQDLIANPEACRRK